MADLAQIEKRITRVRKQAKKEKAAQQELEILEKLATALNDGQTVRNIELSEDEELIVKPLGLLTKKPVIYGTNVSEDDLAEGNEWVEQVRKYATGEDAKVVIISAQVESELVELSEEETKDFLEALGVTEGGLKSLIRATYELLGLRTYLTTGETESRAWTIVAGMTAPQAAGVIHTDFEKKFIKAETIGYQDLIDNGSKSAAKEKGLVRFEGKDYVVKEGDVIEFKVGG